jgi:hypothetical protein
MSFHATVLRQSFPVVFLLGLLAGPTALAQVANSPVVFVSREAIITTFVAAPSLGTGDVTPPAPGNASQWLKVEFHYGVTPVKGDFQDSAEFKIWIEGRDLIDPQGKPGEGIAVGLTGSVTYINIPKGKDVYGVFYVHPSTIARYSGPRGNEDFTRKFNVHVEAYVDGAKVDYFDKNKEQDPNWFQQLKAVPNLVSRQDQCAFLISSPDRYPMIKLPAAQ